jgi:hypothetical protein
LNRTKSGAPAGVPLAPLYVVLSHCQRSTT